MEGYTQHEVEEACATHEAQAMLGHLMDKDFLGMVCSGMIANCPMSPTAMVKANRIFGPDLAGVRRGNSEKAPGISDNKPRPDPEGASRAAFESHVGY